MTSWQEASPVDARHASHGPGPAFCSQWLLRDCHCLTPKLQCIALAWMNSAAEKVDHLLKKVMATRSLPFHCPDYGSSPDFRDFLQHPLMLLVLSANLCYFFQLVIPKSCSLGTATWQTGHHPWYLPMTGWCYVRSSFKAALFLRGICGLCSLQWIFTREENHCISPSYPSW